MNPTVVRVDQIRDGDEFIRNGHGWVALADAETLPNGRILVRVQYLPDGGIGERTWDDAETQVPVRRDR